MAIDIRVKGTRSGRPVAAAETRLAFMRPTCFGGSLSLRRQGRALARRATGAGPRAAPANDGLAGIGQFRRPGSGLLAIALSFLIAGCGKGEGQLVVASLHPLNHAPYAGVLTATLSNFEDRNGKIVVSSATGEALAGEYAISLDEPPGFGSILALGGIRKACSGERGPTADTRACGVGLGSASLSGDLGTTLDCEFLNAPGGSGWGACRSSRGTVYRLIY